MSSPSRSPRQLFRALDRGEITRECFREEMAVHARGLIEEMIEVHENPVAAWIETLRNRRAAARLIHSHGEVLVRELFTALSEVPGFPLANWLWDADHAHLPLYCFLRTRLEPVFRVLKIVSAPYVLTISIEHGSKNKADAMREKFTFSRDRWGSLTVSHRERLD